LNKRFLTLETANSKHVLERSCGMYCVWVWPQEIYVYPPPCRSLRRLLRRV